MQRAPLTTLTLLLAIAATSLRPADLSAAPAAAGGPDMATVDFGFRTGQDQFNRGDFVAAARTWRGAADLMPEAASYKDNRAGIYTYLAEAYEKAVAGDANEAVVREAAAALGAYVDGFTRAYPGETPGEAVTRVLARMQAKVAEYDAARAAATPEPEPEPEPPKPEPPRPAPKPWRGLAAGGGVLVGGGVAMLAVMGAGVARGNAIEGQIEDPANMCYAGMLTGDCAEFDKKGSGANAMFTTGLVVAPLLLGAGVAMLVIAGKRKQSSRQAMTPMFGRGLAGVVFERRF